MAMGRRAAVALVGAVVAVVAGLSYWRSAQATQPPSVVTAAVTRGDVVEVVDATGTVQAVTTVQVGTQVSGTIRALRADFNSQVRRGQVVAELDPSLFETQVEQARATVLRLEADAERTTVQLDDARVKLRRAGELAAQQLIAATDLEAAQVAVRQAEAALRSANAQIVQARASLNQNQVNLDHTVITAPIDGIVVSRNVDVGQTVAASMQAPTLFVIARDLTRMQVNASISEADIGRIVPGQPVSFRVDAYPGRVFSGTVSQVRLEPVVQQNVVSYVTIIDVANPDLALKPGMTATVTVETARAAHVLRVPSAALRLRPTADVLASLGAAAGAAEPRARGRGTGTAEPAGARGQVWVQAEGRIAPRAVAVGINDGTTTAILDGPLQEGDAVVTSIASAGTPAATGTSSPLLPFGARVPGGRGGGGPR